MCEEGCKETTERLNNNLQDGKEFLRVFCADMSALISNEILDMEASRKRLDEIVAGLYRKLENLSPVVKLIVNTAVINVFTQLILCVLPTKETAFVNYSSIASICKDFHTLCITCGERQEELLTEIRSTDFKCFSVNDYISDNVIEPEVFIKYRKQ